VGVDASEPLLVIAREQAPDADDCRFLSADFDATPPEQALPAPPLAPFDLAVLFGVLHGVPGRERRRALLEAVCRRLAPGGLLAFTCWRFADDARLAGRIVPCVDRIGLRLTVHRRHRARMNRHRGSFRIGRSRAGHGGAELVQRSREKPGMVVGDEVLTSAINSTASKLSLRTSIIVIRIEIAAKKYIRIF